MKDFFLWKGGNTFSYAASIASTWIWAPAIFVASSKAYTDGMLGFLLFLIPNILTLVLFAFLAKKVRERRDGFTLADAIAGAGINQKRIHLLVSCIVLICSSCVQFIGLHLILSQWIVNSKLVSAIFSSILALVMVGNSGIKGSIITDTLKYVIMIICGLILFFNTDSSEAYTVGRSGKDFAELWTSFGLTTAIGLLSAPYVDQTFWQRVFSIDKDKVFKTFTLSAFLFGLVPFIFGLIGFYQEGDVANWGIEKVFNGGALGAILAICVLSALLSTLDSNLCAISSIACKEFGLPFRGGQLCMVGLLFLSGGMMVATNLTIIDLFLIYGTIRTCIAVPTILIILNKFNKTRLLIATFLTVVIAPAGYIFGGENAYLFTILALLLPLLGVGKSEYSN